MFLRQGKHSIWAPVQFPDALLLIKRSALSPSAWALATLMGDPDGVADSWLQPGPALAVGSHLDCR